MPSALQSLKAKFDGSPQFWANAPGRGNIIGEHTDHQYYGVLPTCINRSIKIVGAVDPSANFILKLCNEDPAYPTIVYNSYDDMKTTIGSWGMYAISAYTGLMEYMSTGMDKPNQSNICSLVDLTKGETCAKIASTSIIPKGITLMLSSDLPAAAGVSSSSALVVCFIRAFIESILAGPNGSTFKSTYASTNYYKPEKIAEFSVPAERHCGTASGGMDQAIICLGGEGLALNINFNPLTSRRVDLPEGMQLIVANTGKKCAKAENAPFMYNKRVFELRLGNLLLLEAGLKKQGVPSVPDDVLDDSYLPRLRDVERRLKMNYSELVELAKDSMKDEYGRDELQRKFSAKKIDNLLAICGKEVLSKNSVFHLKQPVVHVLTETMRVDEFVKTCSDAKASGEDPVKTSKKLGELMDQSHFSLQKDFMNSCDELEALTRAARNGGAYGARMTGAGWGGCCVVAIKSCDADAVKKAILENYYIPTISKQMKEGDEASTCLPTGKEINFDLLKDSLFVVSPSNCATSGTF